MEIENLDFVGLKIENYRYMDFGYRENTNFGMKMDIVNQICGFEGE